MTPFDGLHEELQRLQASQSQLSLKLGQDEPHTPERGCPTCGKPAGHIACPYCAGPVTGHGRLTRWYDPHTKQPHACSTTEPRWSRYRARVWRVTEAGYAALEAARQERLDEQRAAGLEWVVSSGRSRPYTEIEGGNHGGGACDAPATHPQPSQEVVAMTDPAASATPNGGYRVCPRYVPGLGQLKA